MRIVVAVSIERFAGGLARFVRKRSAASRHGIGAFPIRKGLWFDATIYIRGARQTKTRRSSVAIIRRNRVE